MSRDGTSPPPASDAQRTEEVAADTAAAAEPGALLHAVRSVVQQELRAALARSVGPGETPVTSSTDPGLAVTATETPAGILSTSQSGEEMAVRP